MPSSSDPRRRRGSTVSPPLPRRAARPAARGRCTSVSASEITGDGAAGRSSDRLLEPALRRPGREQLGEVLRADARRRGPSRDRSCCGATTAATGRRRRTPHGRGTRRPARARSASNIQVYRSPRRRADAVRRGLGEDQDAERGQQRRARCRRRHPSAASPAARRPSSRTGRRPR